MQHKLKAVFRSKMRRKSAIAEESGQKFGQKDECSEYRHPVSNIEGQDNLLRGPLRTPENNTPAMPKPRQINASQRQTRADSVQTSPKSINSSQKNRIEQALHQNKEAEAGAMTSTVSSALSAESPTNDRDDPNQSVNPEDQKSLQQALLNGTIDLTDTVEMHQKTQWAPAVTHEKVQFQEHEIVQQNIYREIHNYTYHHRIQPIFHTETLEARHFIPNPDGEGLVEILASQIPSPSGRHRWQNQGYLPVSPVEKTSSGWRSEQEIVEKEPYMTKDGFERRETTILYPPALADLSSYDGEVQPVHFDHSTGQQWLGEITTISKLEEQNHHVKPEPTFHQATRTATIKRKPVNISCI